jgi:hypothetical protein
MAASSSSYQKITYNSTITVSDGSSDSGLSNTHIISNPGGSNTIIGPFKATSNSGNNGSTHHTLFDANGNIIGYPVPEMPGGPKYVLSADDYGGMAWTLFASKIQAALSSSDGSVTFTPTGSGSDIQVNIKVDPVVISQLKWLLTLPPACTEGNIAPQTYGNGTTSTYVANATMLFATSYLSLTKDISKMYAMLTQGTLSDAYFAIYKLTSAGDTPVTASLVANTYAITSTTTGLMSGTIAKVSQAAINPGELHFSVIFTKDNGCQFVGHSRGTVDQAAPYISCFKDNLTVTNANSLPDTITFSGYQSSAFAMAIYQGS